MCKKGFSDWERKKIWLIATGALNAMKSCHPSSAYKQILANFNKDFPNPNLPQIDVDMPRTFPDEEFYK